MRFTFLLMFIGALTVHAADPTSDEKKTIDALAKLGGKATIDENLPKAARITVKFEKATDTTFAALKKFPQVGAVTAFEAKCTEKGYIALKDLPHLRKLVLSRSTQTTKTLTLIGECAELRVLAVPAGGVADAELAGLKKLTRLESLDLSDNKDITDKAMAIVKDFERLESLYLANTQITDKGLFELKPLEGLRTLNATNTKVTADGAMKFADEMPNLRQVRR